jgi:hypothetical protein
MTEVKTNRNCLNLDSPDFWDSPDVVTPYAYFGNKYEIGKIGESGESGFRQ